MADMSNLKKRSSRLGTPPTEAEASHNLLAPEIAPVATSIATAEVAPKRRDGRSARKTNRTLPFSTRVSPEFDNRIRDISERDGLLLVEVLELALAAYEEKKVASMQQ